MKKVASFYLILLLSFVIVGLTGCGDDETVTSGGPSVAWIYPKNGADDIPSTSVIMVTFDREIFSGQSEFHTRCGWHCHLRFKFLHPDI